MVVIHLEVVAMWVIWKLRLVTGGNLGLGKGGRPRNLDNGYDFLALSGRKRAAATLFLVLKNGGIKRIAIIIA